MYNTVSYIEEQSNPRHHFFGELCEYFYIVLHCVEWPRSWKVPLQNRIKAMFPQCQERLDTELANILKARAQREGASGVTPTTTIADQKQLVRQRSLLHTDGKTVEDFQDHPTAGEAFYEKHRSLWSWTMTNEKVLAQEFVTLAAATDWLTRDLLRWRKCGLDASWRTRDWLTSTMHGAQGDVRSREDIWGIEPFRPTAPPRCHRWKSNRWICNTTFATSRWHVFRSRTMWHCLWVQSVSPSVSKSSAFSTNSL